MYHKGDIVLIPFPFTDLSGSKVRPAVVLAGDKKSADVIVAFITSQTKLHSTQVVCINPSRGNGIKVASRIVCDKLATLDKKVMVGKLGICGESVVKEIDCCLRDLFQL